jgi:flagellar L-ring protein precursor FlgH
LAAIERGVGLASLVLFTACTTPLPPPPPIVHQPMSARPEPAPPLPANGAIYQAANARLFLFEDQRARRVGDTVTVRLEERNRADKESNSKVERTSDLNYGVDAAAKLPLHNWLDEVALDADSTNKMEGKGEAESNNNLTGTITVTVIEVLTNGNLLVSGEKQIAINHGAEYIRLSGVINPMFIRADNSVSSSRVADARIEYKGTGYIDEAQTMGWLARFFMWVMPF